MLPMLDSPLLACLDSLRSKRAMLRSERKSVRTLVLGGSPADYGFDPGVCPGAFNLASRGEDLHYAFLLYDRLWRKLPALANIVVFYSAFSSGHVSEWNAALDNHCLAMNEIFRLGRLYENETMLALARRLRGQLMADGVPIPGIRGFLPGHDKGFMPEAFDGEAMVAAIKAFRGGADADVYLARMLILARHLGHRVLVVVPPVRSDVVHAMGRDTGWVFGSLHEIVDDYRPELSLELLDCHGDRRFGDDCFGDCSHLDPSGQGTRTLSGLIRERLA